MWTVEKVKEELPPVKVLVNGKVYAGEIRGRKLDFPTVFFNVNGMEVRGKWAWSTICNCLNNNKPLRY